MVSAGRMNLLDEDGFEMGVFPAWGACIEAAGGVETYLVCQLSTLRTDVGLLSITKGGV
jgi:hypothetical protein